MLCKYCGHYTPDGETCLMCGAPKTGNIVTEEQLKEYEIALVAREAELKAQEKERFKDKDKDGKFTKFTKENPLAVTLMVASFVLFCILYILSKYYDFNLVLRGYTGTPGAGMITFILPLIVSIIFSIKLARNKYKLWWLNLITLGIVIVDLMFLKPLTITGEGRIDAQIEALEMQGAITASVIIVAVLSLACLICSAFLLKKNSKKWFIVLIVAVIALIPMFFWCKNTIASFYSWTFI